MAKEIDIKSGIQPFDDRTDFSRNNADRKPWGRGSGDSLSIADEYKTVTPAAEPEKKVEPTPQVFKHKLSNGTELSANSMEELATLIEKSFQQTAAPVEAKWDDDPLYKPVEFKRKELSLQEQANILNVMKENPQKAYQMLQEAEFGVTLESLLNTLSRAELREFNRREEEAGVEWVLDNVDRYKSTPENGKKLTEYLRKNNRPITKNNLTMALNALVAAGDKNLLYDQPPVVEPEDKTVSEVEPPPTVIPSNLGRPEAPAETKIDPAKFAALPLDKQKEFFASLRRTQ